MPRPGEPDKSGAFLIRNLPRAVMEKMRAAAAIHKLPLKTYIRDLFVAHIRDLERKGVILTLSKGKRLRERRGNDLTE